MAPPSDSADSSSSSSSSEAAASGPFGGEAVASGKKVVRELLQKLAADSDLLPVKVVEIDTVICQNDCSGHGTCHQVKCFNYTPLTLIRHINVHLYSLRGLASASRSGWRTLCGGA